jgi:hypothetical protein
VNEIERARPSAAFEPRIGPLLLLALVATGLRLGAAFRLRAETFARGCFFVFLPFVTFGRAIFFIGMRAVYH